ncbi:hypothetical protein [Hyphobacterium marinum]|uniref:Lipoprotein n=1 Tax=Hyphobacterium marinum TaxID=3116574 RepID=A0ABU7M1G5_9PROT|nr:hypothetical protein [Hyphobacterium sp. Y6023]MEE2567657.1 hypothetical protein [Hyphobacterium sp. Y6023]
MLRSLVLICIASAVVLPGCSSTRDRTVAAARFSGQETRSAVVDAVGLPMDRPGPVMVDQGDLTVPTPYGGRGEVRRCRTVAIDIARLTAVLGEDEEIVDLRAEYEAPQDMNGDGDEDWIDQSRVWADRTGDAAADGARGLYRSVIVGLNPARPLVRFVGRAGEIEQEARDRREMALKRRAYLRGLFDGFGCERRELDRAFREYGLVG